MNEEVKVSAGIYELTADLSSSPYWNKDISPKKISFRLGGLITGIIGILSVSNFWLKLYHYAWFVGFFIAFILYLILMRKERLNNG